MSMVDPAQIEVVVSKVVSSSKNRVADGIAGKFSGEVDAPLPSNRASDEAPKNLKRIRRSPSEQASIFSETPCRQ